MVSQKDKDEIKTHFHGCLDPKKQVGIICDLFPRLKRAEILEVLGIEDKRLTHKKNKEEEEDMGSNKGYNQSVKTEVCKAIMVDGVSYSEAAERFGVPHGNISRWIRDAKARQGEFLNYGAEKKPEEQAEETQLSTKETQIPPQDPQAQECENKSNYFCVDVLKLSEFGILKGEELETLVKIAEKIEIFKKGYKYGKDNT
ncbi:MAG: hypothetical protein RR827_03630 [Oscillospiraceae bacterium]